MMEEEGTKSCTPHAIVEFDKELESTKAKVGKVREENERLKPFLSKIVNDYKSLQNHVLDILQQEQEASQKQSQEISLKLYNLQEVYSHDHLDISLRLGRDSKNSPNKEDNKSPKKSTNEEKKKSKKKELTIGLGFGVPDTVDMNADKSKRFEGNSENLNEEIEEKLTVGTWMPRKIVKTMRSEDDQEKEVLEQLQQPPPTCSLKKTRVCLRVRCDAQTMSDGCQWRKYGQKTAKGNPLLRAYYRCTISPSCPVKKQVQRSVEDSSILITTYEGTHDHPLPIAATAMATATSAAASILQSTSSSSSSSSTNLHCGFSHFFPSNNFPITTSTSNSHPIVTLDLTFPNRKLPAYPSSSTSHLCFSSSDPCWSGPLTLYSNISPSFNGSFTGFNAFKMNRPLHAQDSHQMGYSKDALTAAITSNPSFRTALAAAFTSQADQHRNSGYQNTFSTTSLFSSPILASTSATPVHREFNK